jgi:hypothetical protein
MEKLRLGEATSTMVLEVTPDGLRELAAKLDKGAIASGMGTSIIIPISNSVSVIYNVSVKEKSWVKVNPLAESQAASQTIN